MSGRDENRAAGRKGRMGLLLGSAAALLALALPAAAAAHPAVYDVTRKSAPGGCDWAASSSGACLTDAAKRYVVVNHNIPVAYDETNGLDESYGGVIDFPRFPGAFRSTVPTPADWLAVVPPRTGVQPHASCEASATTSSAAVVGWQGGEPFYAYVPWQSAAAGLDDDPAEWIGYVESLTGVDLTGMDGAAAAAACEALDGGTAVYHPADTPLATSIASGLVAHEVERAVVPLQAEIDGLLSERGSLRGQIDVWNGKGSSLESQVGALAGERADLRRRLAAAQRANAKVRRAGAQRAKTIAKLRRQLKAARQHG